MTEISYFALGSDEIGWSSHATATGALRRPYPRVYEHDVVRLHWGLIGTVIDRRGPWLEIEHVTDSGNHMFWETRVDGVTVVWSRPS